ncbi:MAG: DUF1624 domain-containing protein [Candidatus Harrisonbacteria bacterium]|nr:DUF1624 domain-containing protein [Candidatus Harrisonbacteria bacterium]
MYGRLEEIDEMRGLAVFIMIIFDFLYMFTAAPPWLKHSTGNGFTIADLVAPLFLFALGLSYPLSLYRRRESRGLVSAILHFMRRSLTLILFGILGEFLVRYSLTIRWGVLQMIGLSSLLSLPFLFVGYKKRLAAAFGFIAAWHLIFLFLNVDDPNLGSMGGPMACLGWMSIVLLATSLMEMYEQKLLSLMEFSSYVNWVLIIWLGVYVCRIIGQLHSPINKWLVTAPYILYSLEWIIPLFVVFQIKEHFDLRIPILSLLGKNALILYMLAGIFGLLVEKNLPSDLPVYLVFVTCVSGTSVMILFAKYLDRKQWYFKV